MVATTALPLYRIIENSVVDIVVAAGMNETYATYVDGECYDKHFDDDVTDDDTDDDTDNDTDDDTIDDTGDDTYDAGRWNLY